MKAPKNLQIVISEMSTPELKEARPKCERSGDVRCVEVIDQELIRRGVTLPGDEAR